MKVQNGLDTELQNTHFVLFKSPRDVQQIDVLGKQLGLGHTLRTWGAIATSTPYGHLMIGLSPKTIDLLRYCTDATSFPSKFYSPSGRSRITQIIDQKSKLLYSEALSSFQQSITEIFPQLLFQIFIRFLLSVLKREKVLRRLNFIG